ncbi:MAG: DnaB-like helicase C-terminal domain-containing protein [Sulfitobacter sp.]|uniref:replicative DNA helicase n=1 Tax=Alphaproteobacteria TaxID=28211 RepID=UPI00329A78A7
MNQIVSIKPELPHSVEAEQQLLGAILLGFGTEAVTAVGGADIFYDPVHAEIFQACLRLEKNSKPITPVTVGAAISDDLSDRLSELGGKAYLARLAGASVSAKWAADYAKVIAEAKAKRDLIAIIEKGREGLSNGELLASDVAAQMEAAFGALAQSESAVKPVSMLKAVTEAVEQSHAAYMGESINSVPSGIRSLDQIVSGFGGGEMWLLGGRPSMGKTGVALSMGLNAARAGHPVIIASLEMTPSAMAMRALSEETARLRNPTSYSDMRRGEYSDQQGEGIREAARAVANLPITFLPRQYQDTDLLQVGVKQALRHAKNGKTPLVLVDYAQLLRSKAKTRYEQVTEISLALKGMAMDLNVPVVALSQLSRALEQREDKRPMMSDLRESGQLEQDADGVMFCYRDEYYLQREEPPHDDMEVRAAWHDACRAAHNKLEIIVAKQRQGEIATAHVMFNPALNLVWEQ